MSSNRMGASWAARSQTRLRTRRNSPERGASHIWVEPGSKAPAGSSGRLDHEVSRRESSSHDAQGEEPQPGHVASSAGQRRQSERRVETRRAHLLAQGGGDGQLFGHFAQEQYSHTPAGTASGFGMRWARWNSVAMSFAARLSVSNRASRSAVLLT